jgi:hypothetical protein
MTMDISKFSTQDLEAMQSGDISKMSDEGLSLMQSYSTPHEGMEHKVSHGQGMTAMPSTYNEQAALERTLMQDANPLERQAYGALSAPMLAGYGAKQFVTGGTLSPEDQNAVKNWHVVEKVAPLGAVAGNVGMMALPAQLRTSQLKHLLLSVWVRRC